MKSSIHRLSAILLLGGLVASSAVMAAGNAYKVTITNLTRGTSITPMLVATHAAGFKLFHLGSAASDSLAMMAEGGDTSSLQTDLMDSGKLFDSTSSGGLLGPGESVTVTVATDGAHRRLSLAGMMLPTNDGFIALDGVAGPRYGSTTYYSPGYDAGSEDNSELCSEIPGPLCGGDGYQAGGGEGYVHVHAGLHGIGDLAPADHDWRNPVVSVRVSLINH